MAKIVPPMGLPYGVEGYPALGKWFRARPCGKEKELEEQFIASVAEHTLEEVICMV